MDRLAELAVGLVNELSRGRVVVEAAEAEEREEAGRATRSEAPVLRKIPVACLLEVAEIGGVEPALVREPRTARLTPSADALTLVLKAGLEVAVTVFCDLKGAALVSETAVEAGPLPVLVVSSTA